VLKRVWFPLVALFWVAMNVLLWRAEMMSRPAGGSPVSPDLVWERMLTAPDDSSLEIRQHDRKLGWLRWVPRVEEGTEAPASGSAPAAGDGPEGLVRRITGYTVVLDGNLAPPDAPQRYRFNGQLEFDAAKNWQSLHLRVTLRPQVWELRADARTQTVTFKVGEEAHAAEFRFTFAELAQPEALLSALGLPVPPGTLQYLLPPALAGGPRKLALGLTWDARSDWHQIGSARARAYRVSARLLDKYEVRLVLSRVGEILQVELPNKITLVSDALADFPLRP
jgi:hypothetical protein